MTTVLIILNSILFIGAIVFSIRASTYLKLNRDMAYSAMIGWSCMALSTLTNLMTIIKQ